jgi:hypothetical protein
LLVTIGTLLFFEQVAIIFVLASVGLIVLLLLVAFSDLEKVGMQAQIEARLIEEPDAEITIPKGANKIEQSYRGAGTTPDRPRGESGRIVS